MTAMTSSALRRNLGPLGTSQDSVADLRRHLQQCHLARGRWFGAAMLAERVHQLAAPRFATTVGLAAIALTTACMFL